ncbi:divergent PAP2 family protein [Oribacterium sp. WCC10]|uniref:divergent PAP2 family protein n=1 Tax=Oribacterium sp. WCC10 TaxID=1855343 RepID=UPI0008F4033F|nr:divergent PAP2 family protein [Oribacterium sp. WCC10]SFG21056.1 hypothetical protein SAMN05216356_103158 [Oribacterium sp. WCC10]
MNFFDELLSNYMLVTAVVSWFSAQVIKTAIDAYFNRGINWERMTGSGGMPSSHSSFVVSIATAAALQYGISSSYFAMSFALASVVMYDATGVRRETGKQAVLLNKILEDNPFNWKPEEFEMKLKEYVGHTPLQVLMGAILGIVVAFLVKIKYPYL